MKQVCQGYHWVNAFHNFRDQAVVYPTTDNPDLEGWHRVSSTAFDPGRNPAWLCPDCYRRYIKTDLKEDLKMVKEDRMAKIIRLSTVFYQTDPSVPKRDKNGPVVYKCQVGDKPLWVIHPDLEFPLISAVEWNGLTAVKIGGDNDTRTRSQKV